MWFLYNILFSVGYLLLLPSFVLRMRRRGGYRQDFGERFGFYAPEKRRLLAQPGRIWVHAVSVGEALVALSFIQTVRKNMPQARFLISSTTSTGHALLAERKAKDDVLIYYPIDFPWIVRRAVDRIRPSRMILTECELWPNLLRMLNRSGIPVVVINGRISESSYRGYRRIRWFFRHAAKWVQAFLVQTETDAQRLIDLGVDPATVTVTGSVKFDAPEAAPEISAHTRQIIEAAGLDPAGRFWVVGSSWPGEERVVLSIFKQLRKRHHDLQLILVPRHMERRTDVVQQVEHAALPYTLRSSMSASLKPNDTTDPLAHGGRPVVLIADTTGELFGYYSLADLVFVGKSLGDHHGGQNPIEPAALSKPVVVGPHMENFAGVMRELLDGAALIQVSDAAELEATCQTLLDHDADRHKLAARAGAFIASRRGVMARTAALAMDPV